MPQPIQCISTRMESKQGKHTFNQRTAESLADPTSPVWHSCAVFYYLVINLNTIWLSQFIDPSDMYKHPHTYTLNTHANPCLPPYRPLCQSVHRLTANGLSDSPYWKWTDILDCTLSTLVDRLIVHTVTTQLDQWPQCIPWIFLHTVLGHGVMNNYSHYLLDYILSDNTVLRTATCQWVNWQKTFTKFPMERCNSVQSNTPTVKHREV